MADEVDFESKTEPATQRRREEAHEQGHFAFSTELVTGFTLLVGIGGLAFLAHTLGSGLLGQTRVDLAGLSPTELTQERTQTLIRDLCVRGLTLAGFVLGVFVVATIAVHVGQAGFLFNVEKLSIDLDRISPFEWDRLVSWAKTMRGLMLLLKIVAVAAVAWWILRQRVDEMAHLGDAGLAPAVERSWSLAIRLALGLAGVLFAIGALDYGWQRWQFERSIAMTRQELKEEIKRDEGDPQVKGRVRKLQRDAAQRKMFERVSKATVVITNPTHLAVAIEYEPGKMSAPKVIAKGAGHIAKRIVELARQHGVPVIERKPLAQALFKTVRLDREIPMAFYFVVAELLAYVYQIKGGAPRGAATAPAS